MTYSSVYRAERIYNKQYKKYKKKQKIKTNRRQDSTFITEEQHRHRTIQKKHTINRKGQLSIDIIQ